MSQEYTEDKEVTLKKLSSGRRLLEALLVLVALFAIYLMVSLLSFNPSDPSWSQTAWHEPIHNLGGIPGAWLADTLFFIFGVIAYAIPVILIGGCWFTWKQRDAEYFIDYFAVSLRLIGVLAMILTSCGLAAINADDIWYFASGGVIGSLLSTALQPQLNSSGGTLILLCVWAAGLTLFTGWSWVSIAEKIGSFTLSILTFASHHTRRDNTWQDDDYLDEPETDPEPAKKPARGTRMLRGALSRRQKLSQKFSPQQGTNVDKALFSGKRMDDEDDEEVRAPVAHGDADDVLFSGHSVTDEALPDDPLFSGQSVHDENDPLFNGQSAPDTVAASPVHEPELSEGGHFAPVAPLAATFNTPEPEPRPAAVSSPQRTVSEPVPVDHRPPAAVSSVPVYDTPVAVSPEPDYSVTDVREEPAMSPPEPSEEAKYVRPPLYHFEEVEQQRAREREQLAAWYQPTEEPQPYQYSSPASERAESTGRVAATGTVSSTAGSTLSNAAVSVTSAASVANPVAAASSTVSPVFSIASDTPRPQVKEGIGPQLPRPNRVRVPTRRELASYGIKLPSQRMAEARARVEHLTQQQNPVDEGNELHQHGLGHTFAAQQQQGYSDRPELDEDVAAEAELSRQFAAQQQARYGEYSAEAEEDMTAEDAAAEAELSRQFAAQQQQRYHQTHQADSASTAPFSLDDFEFHSPMKELVSDGPMEPLFTPIAESVTGAAAPPGAPDHVAPAQSSSHRPAPPLTVSLPEEAAVPTRPVAEESLIHPFLMRNGDSRPLQKPTTPLPSLDLLASPPATIEPVDEFAMRQLAHLVEARLADYRIKATVVDYSPGPVITRFELDLAPGVKAARISNLSRDLARSLSTVAVRVVEVIPGKPYVGLELPNKKRQTVYLREVLDCPAFRDSSSPLTVVLGKDIGGEPVVADLAKMPHLLVAGTTGSGKSVGVNAMILSMLYKATPEEVRFIMIDPKMLELSVYEGIPHLLTEVVTDMKDAANALRWSVNEMERRYKLMSALGVRNLAGYNDRVLEAEKMGRPIPDPFWKPGDSMEVSHPMLEKLPYIVVLVDEFADLMMTVGKKVEELIARLAQKARAAGIHLVLATQRPSVDVITGLIKANIPTRIAFTVSSKIDSRTILDQGGAESLLGMGDMLYSAPNSTTPVRVHGAFVRDQEVHAVVQDWKARGRPQYITGITSSDGAEGGGGLDGDEELDPLFDQAVAFVVEKRKASISGVQRQFRIGYNRAARIVEQMEAQGIVSPQGHNGNREVLAPPPYE